MHEYEYVYEYVYEYEYGQGHEYEYEYVREPSCVQARVSTNRVANLTVRRSLACMARSQR